MDVDLIPVLIEQYREIFEGEVHPGWCWIIDGKDQGASLFGTLQTLSVEQAFAAPVSGHKSVAAHLAHLRFALDLTLQRMQGENPAADWRSSFDIPSPSAEAWLDLQRDVRRAYTAMLADLQARQHLPVTDWLPIQVVGLSGMIAHNAYHLGAIRQITQVVQGR